MYWMVNRKSDEALQQAGFNKWQIHRLYKLREEYQQEAHNPAALDLARLQFARWLVLNGKLTEQLSQ